MFIRCTFDFFSLFDDIYCTISAVLFNIYGPAVEEDDIERVRFKLLFYKILQVLHVHLSQSVNFGGIVSRLIDFCQ